MSHDGEMKSGQACGARANMCEDIGMDLSDAETEKGKSIKPVFSVMRQKYPSLDSATDPNRTCGSGANIRQGVSINLADTAIEKGGTAKTLFSVIPIIVVNLFLMLTALKARLSITELIWLYWCEGVVIGLIQSFKVFSTESTSISVLKGLRPDTPPISLTIFFSALQIPFHCLFAVWIYNIDPTFDYANALLMMGGVIFAHELFYYIRNSRPWREPEDLKNVIVESGIYLVRFVPVLALYHFMVKTQAGEGNITLLTLEFMLFKLASDVISHCIKGYLLKNAI
ncbi:MAG: DUF6498-containing protein [Planctomycetota bacterium]|jgi:hypothetical protein